ncbi:MAG TPA: hypothetical protein VE988_30675 [Gemmataceae bacterium]|nr:hypothetical protein [Gemmataceae bacterium]
MATEPKAHETKPVLAADGHTTLGFCEVKKYRRSSGQPLKEIIIRDTAMTCVATIYVYKLHSRVHCGSLAVEGQPVDSKLAVDIARAALEYGQDAQTTLKSILEAAQRLSLPRQQSSQGKVLD